MISLASGRVVEIHARLGDTVTKGPAADEGAERRYLRRFLRLPQGGRGRSSSRTAQLERAKMLYDKGAIAQKDLEVAEDAEDKAKVDVETTQEHLRVLGADTDIPPRIVDVFAPVSGVITDQQVTIAAGVAGLDIAQSVHHLRSVHVWIICDVYENDLTNVHVGEFADVRLNAYPDRVFKGRISNIGPILDPNIRTAKVRLEVANPGHDAARHVRHRHLPRTEQEEHRRRSRHRDPASARSRLGLRARGGRPVPPRGRGRRQDAAGQHAGIVSGLQPGRSGGDERAGSAEHRGAVGKMIRGFVDFALNNRFLVLALRRAAVHLGRHLVP